MGVVPEPQLAQQSLKALTSPVVKRLIKFKCFQTSWYVEVEVLVSLFLRAPISILRTQQFGKG